MNLHSSTNPKRDQLKRAAAGIMIYTKYRRSGNVITFKSPQVISFRETSCVFGPLPNEATPPNISLATPLTARYGIVCM